MNSIRGFYRVYASCRVCRDREMYPLFTRLQSWQDLNPHLDSFKYKALTQWSNLKSISWRWVVISNYTRDSKRERGEERRENKLVLIYNSLSDDVPAIASLKAKRWWKEKRHSLYTIKTPLSDDLPVHSPWLLMAVSGGYTLKAVTRPTQTLFSLSHFFIFLVTIDEDQHNI